MKNINILIGQRHKYYPYYIHVCIVYYICIDFQLHNVTIKPIIELVGPLQLTMNNKIYLNTQVF